MKTFLKKLNFTPEKIIIRLFAAWLGVNYLIMLAAAEAKFTDLSYAQDVGLLNYLIFCISAFLIFTVLDILLPRYRTDGKLLLISILALGFKTVSVAQNYYYACFLLIAVASVMYYLIKRRWLTIPAELTYKLQKFEENKAKWLTTALAWSAVVVCFGVFSYIVGAIGALRYMTYSSPNYDFGIFCNMFHNMKTSFLPLVTSERDAFLSHFAVHISPIYYLMLPFYAILPSPITLQIGQAVVLASGVVPLYLICRKYELKKLYSVLLAIAYICYPALSGGTFYDLHENCFLTPLLLWTFYFFEKEKYIPTYIFAVLTLAVKEDAAIYVAFFALYVLIASKQKRWHGAILLAISVTYFALAVFLLSNFGDGAMVSGRYGNYIANADEGVVGMVKTVIFNPGYVFVQFANTTHIASKLLYMLQMLVPLGFIPFINKKISRFVLVMPFVLINLMTLYVYQFDIGFQYSFGSAAFLLWLTVMNIADMKPIGKRFAVSFCAIASAMLFAVCCTPKYTYYIERYEENQATYEKMDSILSGINKECSVTCSTMLLPHLADREEIYELAYHDISGENPVLTDYLIIDLRYDSPNSKEVRKYKELGYVELAKYPGMIQIFALPTE